MISSHLAALLAPFAQLANKHALSDLYKCVEIGPTHVRGAAAYGILEASLKLGFDETIWIDANTLVAVLKSLPSSEEVTFEVKGGTLFWECGNAAGKLALLGQQSVPAIDSRALKNLSTPWKPPAAFLEALELGALSCGSQGMATAGVYGVVLDNRGDFSVLSSDNVTIAACKVGEEVEGFPERATFSPEALAMLACVIDDNFVEDAKSDEHCAEVSMGGTLLYCKCKAFRLIIRAIPEVKHDLRATMEAFAFTECPVDLPQAPLAAFIKRTTALAESKARVYVKLAVAEGALSLSFDGGASSSDEYFVVEALAVPEVLEIKLDAERIARALTHTQQLVLDHMERHVLVMRGADPAFFYMISGQRPAQ